MAEATVPGVTVESLCSWLDASPTPVHVVSTASRRLEAAGFRRQADFSHELHEAGYHSLDGVIVAWRLGGHGAPLRVLGAHTDSPNLRVQPHPDMTRSGWSQLGVEIYGGVLLNSWLDRDLGLAGRVVDSAGNGTMFMEAAPIARLPQLAIHLDREISERGLLIDRFAHTSPVWGTNAPGFVDWLGQVTGVADIASFDAQFFDITPATVLGVDGTMLASGRLDNQLSCWAAIEALIRSKSSMHEFVILNDHEEVGSASSTGAAGPMLENLLALLRQQEDLDLGAHMDRLARSWCLSADNAHAVHPNYAERHDPRHSPMPNQGVAVKVNANQRYATSTRGLAHIRGISDAAGVPMQTFVSRNNMPCGSTIGPITATRLGIEAIDVGVPQLSMHSAREMCGLQDALALPVLMGAFLSH